MTARHFYSGDDQTAQRRVMMVMLCDVHPKVPENTHTHILIQKFYAQGGGTEIISEERIQKRTDRMMGTIRPVRGKPHILSAIAIIIVAMRARRSS